MAGVLEWLDKNVTNWKPQQVNDSSQHSQQLTTSEDSDLDTHDLQLLITRSNLDMIATMSHVSAWHFSE